MLEVHISASFNQGLYCLKMTAPRGCRDRRVTFAANWKCIDRYFCMRTMLNKQLNDCSLAFFSCIV
jgi:hypothetical protein